MWTQNTLLHLPAADAADASLALADAGFPAVPGGNALALAFVGLLVAAILLERSKPHLQAGLDVVKKSYRFNLITFLLNDFVLSLISLPTLYLVAESYSDLGFLSDMENGPGKFLLCFLLLDFVLYAWHYLMHHDDGLWTFHRVHHDDASLNVTTGLRFHTGELVLEIMVRSLFIVVVGVNAGLVLACQGIVSLFVLLHHANVRLPGEKALSWIFIMPRLHRVHHSVLRAEHDSNYGAVFSIWDRIFGTLKEQEPTAIGLLPDGTRGFLDFVQDALHALVPGHKPAVLPVPVERDGRKRV